MNCNDSYEKALKKNQKDEICKNNCGYFPIPGPTGPTGATGITGPTGPTERLFKSSNKMVIDSS